ncbi:MAG: 30S ribosomal protein S8 [Holosporales bacterium]|jgi:small subunit ribosomal protein S8|nr:30S ribosomal protein S8 [Holosporales bacterium]
MITDPIGDLLTRIRNGLKARKVSIDVPASKMRGAVLDVLVDEGYLTGYSKEPGVSVDGVFRVILKYVDGAGVIKSIARVSKPGRRVYSSVKSLRPVHNGLGINILSTSKGVISDANAREWAVGGEVLCSVF